MRNFLNEKPPPDTQKSPFLRKGPTSEAMLGGEGVILRLFGQRFNQCFPKNCGEAATFIPHSSFLI